MSVLCGVWCVLCVLRVLSVCCLCAVLCVLCVLVWWMEVGWEGSPPHNIAHTMHGAHAQVELFLFFAFSFFLFI